MLYGSVTGPKGPDWPGPQNTGQRSHFHLPPVAGTVISQQNTASELVSSLPNPAELGHFTKRGCEREHGGSGTKPHGALSPEASPRRAEYRTVYVGAERHCLASFILQNASNKILNIKMDNARIMGYSVGEVQKFSCGSSRIMNSFTVWLKGCTDHTRQRALTSSPRAGWSLPEAERPRRGSLPRPSPCA